MGRAVASPPALDALVTYGRSCGRPAVDVLADVAAGVVHRWALPVDPATLPLATAAGAPAGPPDRAVTAALAGAGPAEVAPDLLGQLHEALLDRGHRHRRGVFYTPPAIAAGIADLVDWPAPGPGREAPRVCDPSVGGGAFLLAAARVLERLGWARSEIVGHGLWGVDVDPVAVAVAATALVLWAAAEEGTGRRPIVAGDTLVQGPDVWNGRHPGEGFDVVIGNPPFQSQLGRGTARPVSGPDAEGLRRRFGSLAYRYTDTAALFLLEACRWLRPGGQVALVLPQSVLVAGDAAALRRAVLDLGRLERLWVAGEPVFDASVRVCVPVLRRDAGPAVRSGRRAGDRGGGGAGPALHAGAPGGGRPGGARRRALVGRARPGPAGRT